MFFVSNKKLLYIQVLFFWAKNWDTRLVLVSYCCGLPTGKAIRLSGINSIKTTTFQKVIGIR